MHTIWPKPLDVEMAVYVSLQSVPFSLWLHTTPGEFIPLVVEVVAGVVLSNRLGNKLTWIVCQPPVGGNGLVAGIKNPQNLCALAPHS